MSNFSAVLTSRPYAVRGDSMRPALRAGEVMLVSACAYAKSPPARGDVVVVRDPGGSGIELLKRVVGMPGDHLGLSEGSLYLNGETAVETYLAGLPSSVGLAEGDWQLGGGEFFVLGDRRVRSTDSREFGPVTLDQIAGRAWCRIWPPHRWSLI